MKTETIKLETSITISYEEIQRKAAISLLEYCLPRGINGYEDRRYDAWTIYGHLLYHLFPNRYNEGEFKHVIDEVEKEGVHLVLSRESMNQVASTTFRHTENPHNNQG